MAKRTIFIAGHLGMVGSAIARQLEKNSDNIILTTSRLELDLTNQAEVNSYFENKNIDQVYLAAAKVGGIHANNKYPAEFIYENLMIEANVINAAHINGVQNLLFLGSSCIYPKLTEQPIKEDALLTGKLEETNEPYAIAKIAGIKLCESYNRQYGRDYRAVMPTNLYGPGDNYHPENSHVIPALIHRIHEAKKNKAPKVVIWGSGKPRREFLYVEDMALATIFVMGLEKEKYDKYTKSMTSHLNIGSGYEYTIAELTNIIVKVIGYEGDIEWDKNRPDGTPRKLLDSSIINKLGWQPEVDLNLGIEKTYRAYLKNKDQK